MQQNYKKGIIRLRNRMAKLLVGTLLDARQPSFIWHMMNLL